MSVIIKGQNTPIQMAFDPLDDLHIIRTLSASLYKNKNDDEEFLKQWELDDVEIDFDNNIISFPLTEEESFSFPHGTAYFELKINDNDFKNRFVDIAPISIAYRKDGKEIANA